MFLAASAPAIAATSHDTLLYAAADAWVVDAPVPVDVPAPADLPARVAYLDNQVRITPDGTQEAYTAYRVKILKPEALPAGNIAISWQPSDGSATIHCVQLIRDGRITDVLAATKFTVLQREAQLEQSTLSGIKTATLQIPGLQVGDEIAVALTVRQRPAAFGGHVAGVMQMPIVAMPGSIRFRLNWPRERKLIWRTTKDLPISELEENGAQRTLVLSLSNPKSSIPTEGAPLRYNVRRLIEYSDFGEWPDVSRGFSPLYERAAQLAPASPIKAEAARIAARTKDPIERTQAALQLVEDRIRYVYVALDGGNYVPASADETWRRRFGDCKAKTVLLVALLRALDVAAEPALVSSNGGDGTDERLAGPASFDHVIVRAVVADKTVWLDGTRLGDRYLDNLPSPFRWALPLTPDGAPLVAIAPHDSGYPGLIGIVDIDATAGVGHDAHVTAQDVIRGDEAFVLQLRLAALSADDADRAVRAFWRQQIDWLTPDKTTWSYDERRMAMTLGVAGVGNPGWKGDAAEGHNLSITGAGFYAPDPMRRPSEQHQAAPWGVEFPRFRCWATTIRLPPPAPKMAWSLYADPVNLTLGGRTYWRASALNGTMLRTVMSAHSIDPEVSPNEAEILNRAIPTFNNNMSSISEIRAVGKPDRAAGRLPFADGVDWVNAPTPCSSPK